MVTTKERAQLAVLESGIRSASKKMASFIKTASPEANEELEKLVTQAFRRMRKDVYKRSAELVNLF